MFLFVTILAYIAAFFYLLRSINLLTLSEDSEFYIMAKAVKLSTGADIISSAVIKNITKLSVCIVWIGCFHFGAF